MTGPEQLSAQEVTAVEALAERAGTADGVGALSDHARLHLRRGGGTDLIVRTPDGEIAGYAHLDDHDAELVVDPDHRRAGHGTALLRGLEALAPPPLLRVWAHGQLPAAVGLAAAVGYAPVRELWQMARPLTGDGDVPDPKPLDGLRLRAFRPGEDEDAWLAVNARAFASHAEQGSWTATDLAEREAESWFDPRGLIVAEDTSSGAMAGFHWTKVHPGKVDPDGGAEPDTGEVYVLAVDPAYQGRGLGPALTVAGLRHLQERGLHRVMLYVDGDNAPAIATYRRLGFERTALDVMYAASR